MKLVWLIPIVFIGLISPPVEASSQKRHTVKQGESLAEVALFHGVGQNALREANGLAPSDIIRPGDTLEIPDVLIGGWTKGHRVKSGDTLARIAKKYKVSINELKEINRIGKKGRLKLGRRLVIPKGNRVDSVSASDSGPKDEKKARDLISGHEI